MQKELEAEVSALRALGCEVVERGNYRHAVWSQDAPSIRWWKLRVSNTGFWLAYSVGGWRAGRNALDIYQWMDCTPAPSAELALYSAVVEERAAMQDQLIWLQGEYNEIREAARELRQRVESAEEEAE